MLNHLFRLLIVLLSLYLGVGVGGFVYIYSAQRVPIIGLLADVSNPIRLCAALTLPILIPVVSIRLVWAGTLISALSLILWLKCPWWFIVLPFTTSIFLGYLIMDVWRTG
jgi:hypothetical protein